MKEFKNKKLEKLYNKYEDAYLEEVNNSCNCLYYYKLIKEDINAIFQEDLELLNLKENDLDLVIDFDVGYYIQLYINNTINVFPDVELIYKEGEHEKEAYLSIWNLDDYIFINNLTEEEILEKIEEELHYDFELYHRHNNLTPEEAFENLLEFAENLEDIKNKVHRLMEVYNFIEGNREKYLKIINASYTPSEENFIEFLYNLKSKLEIDLEKLPIREKQMREELKEIGDVL